MQFCKIVEVPVEFPSITYIWYKVQCPEYDKLPANEIEHANKFYFKNRLAAMKFAEQQEKIEQKRHEQRLKEEKEATHFRDYISNPARKVLIRHFKGKVKPEDIVVYGKLAAIEKIAPRLHKDVIALGNWHVFDCRIVGDPPGKWYRVRLDEIPLPGCVLELAAK